MVYIPLMIALIASPCLHSMDFLWKLLPSSRDSEIQQRPEKRERIQENKSIVTSPKSNNVIRREENTSLYPIKDNNEQTSQKTACIPPYREQIMVAPREPHHKVPNTFNEIVTIIPKQEIAQKTSKKEVEREIEKKPLLLDEQPTVIQHIASEKSSVAPKKIIVTPSDWVTPPSSEDGYKIPHSGDFVPNQKNLQQFLTTLKWMTDGISNKIKNATPNDLDNLKKDLLWQVNNDRLTTPEVNNSKDYKNIFEECYIKIFDKEVTLLRKEIQTKIKPATKNELQKVQRKLEEVEIGLKLNTGSNTTINATNLHFFLERLVDIENKAIRAMRKINENIQNATFNDLENLEECLFAWSSSVKEMNNKSVTEQYKKHLELSWTRVWNQYVEIIEEVKGYEIAPDPTNFYKPYNEALSRVQRIGETHLTNPDRSKIESLRQMLYEKSPQFTIEQEKKLQLRNHQLEELKKNSGSLIHMIDKNNKVNVNKMNRAVRAGDANLSDLKRFKEILTTITLSAQRTNNQFVIQHYTKDLKPYWIKIYEQCAATVGRTSKEEDALTDIESALLKHVTVSDYADWIKDRINSSLKNATLDDLNKIKNRLITFASLVQRTHNNLIEEYKKELEPYWIRMYEDSSNIVHTSKEKDVLDENFTDIESDFLNHFTVENYAQWIKNSLPFERIEKAPLDDLNRFHNRLSTFASLVKRTHTNLVEEYKQELESYWMMIYERSVKLIDKEARNTLRAEKGFYEPYRDALDRVISDVQKHVSHDLIPDLEGAIRLLKELEELCRIND